MNRRHIVAMALRHLAGAVDHARAGIESLVPVVQRWAGELCGCPACRPADAAWFALTDEQRGELVEFLHLDAQDYPEHAPANLAALAVLRSLGARKHR